jgi:hypothetical protein
MKDVYIVQCLMETDLYKLLKTQVSIEWSSGEASGCGSKGLVVEAFHSIEFSEDSFQRLMK